MKQTSWNDRSELRIPEWSELKPSTCWKRINWYQTARRITSLCRSCIWPHDQKERFRWGSQGEILNASSIFLEDQVVMYEEPIEALRDALRSYKEYHQEVIVFPRDTISNVHQWSNKVRIPDFLCSSKIKLASTSSCMGYSKYELLQFWSSDLWNKFADLFSPPTTWIPGTYPAGAQKSDRGYITPWSCR